MGQGIVADSGVETFGLGEAPSGIEGTTLDGLAFEQQYPVPDSTNYGVEMTDPSNVGLMQAEQNMNMMANINQGADIGYGFDKAAYSSVPDAPQGFNMAEGLSNPEPFSYTQAPTQSGSFSLENIGGSPAAGGLEGVGQATEAGSLFQNESLLSKDVPYGQDATWTSSTQPAAPIVERGTTQPWTNKATNMVKSSDDWLKKQFGAQAPTTSRLVRGGGQFLMDQYEQNKLQRVAEGLKPLSFADFQKQYSNEADYRQAASSMGRQGRTGALPALLARMKQRDRNAYANYLPNAQQQYLGARSDLSALKTNSLSNLFGTIGFPYGVK